MLSVEKVYDELYGMIEDLKKKIAAISSGDEVTITPALESGTKIADFTIGEDEGALYAPTPFSFVFSDTPQKIGTLDGDDLYAVMLHFDDVSVSANSSTEINVSAISAQKCLAIFGMMAGDPIPNIFTSAALSAYNTGLNYQCEFNKITVSRGSGSALTNVDLDIVIVYVPSTETETRSKKKK